MADTEISGYQIYHCFLAGYQNISRHREHINRINVFPVPDGDTGNNMIRTFRTIIEELECERSAGSVMERVADLSLSGARGNSGIILSQYLNSIADKIGARKTLSIRSLGRFVKESVVDAYRAMENPEEGTILTVIESWADAVHAGSIEGLPAKTIMTRAYDVARNALKRTPEQLAVLKENKVVDAGAWGFVSFIEGIQRFLRSGPLPYSIRREMTLSEEAPQGFHEAVRHDAYRELEFRYCTEILIADPMSTPAEIRDHMKGLGDSLIVSHGKNRIRVHIHSNTPGEVVKVGRESGLVIQQKVDDMLRQEQVVNRRVGRIAVLTDSIADIPMELLDRYQIHVLNQTLLWDDEEYLDRLTLSPDDFYELQGERSSFPGSAAPERRRVDDTYGYLMEHYAGMIVLPVAKALSGTWQQMTLASEKFNEGERRISVIDTCLNSVAQGLLVVEVARRAAEGYSLEELEQCAENLKKRIRIFVSVSTFKFMVRGGRVSPLKGLLANILNLKPIISLDAEGRGVAFDKSFSAAGLLRKIAEIVRAMNDSPGIVEYAVVHASAPERAAKFSSLAERITGMPPSYITDISPIVGMHSGRGAVAIGIIEADS